MLGLVRLALALLVLTNHLWVHAENRLGFHAVVAFYMTSGYLMTKVIHEVYGTDGPGVARFLWNRALRVYPPYWLFVAATAGLVLGLPVEVRFLGPRELPTDRLDWLANITLVDLTWSRVILVPPAWSLGIEVLFYFAMPLLLARSGRAIAAWLAASLVVTALLVISDAGFGYRYYPAYAASLYFSAGAALYWYRDFAARLAAPRSMLAPLLVLFAAFPVLVEGAGLSHLTYGYYGAATLFAPILVAAATTETRPRWRPIDRWLGDLAYPVFLSHFFVATLVKAATIGVVESRSTAFLGLAGVSTLAVSMAYVALIDAPLQRLRARVREGTLSSVPRVQPRASRSRG